MGGHLPITSAHVESQAPLAPRPGLEGRASEAIARLTRVAMPPICPEIGLLLASDMTALWAAMELDLGIVGMPPPLWSVAWAGGQAIARYLLDNPQLAAGRRVLDVGSGSGICAIAAAKAGAASVIANDTDPLACLAISQNGALNRVKIKVDRTDWVGVDVQQIDLVLAADVWYERQLAERITPWLRHLARKGATVLLGDKGRRHLPQRHLLPIANYPVPTPESLEPVGVTNAKVWRFSSLT